MNTWTKEIPKQAGYYWFYGDPFTDKRWTKPEDIRIELSLVEIRKISNGFVYIARGNFMENKIGFWQKAELPELPLDK